MMHLEHTGHLRFSKIETGSFVIELSSRDFIPLDGAIIPVPTAFNCIETAIGKSWIASYNNCVPNINKSSTRVCQGGSFASFMIFIHIRYSLFLEIII